MLEFLGETLDVLGKILIAMTAIGVHDSVLKEHKIDAEVSKSIRKEHIYGYLGIVLLVLGYVLRQLGKYAS